MRFDFRKSSYSGQGANCVEVAARTDDVLVRDSKDATGATIAFSRAQWAGFLDILGHEQRDR